MELDFEIDKITESIENAETGETLDTYVLPVTKDDLKEITKKNGWIFTNLNDKYINSLPNKNHRPYKDWYRLKKCQTMYL